MPDFQPADPDYAARVRASFGRQGFMRSLGAELTVCQVDVFALMDGTETLCATMQQTVIRLANRPDGRAAS